MKTDAGTEENGRNDSSEVQVRFEYESNTVKGFVKADALQRTKIAFLEGPQPECARLLGRRLPYDRERWVCRVLRDTNPHQKTAGALYVQLVRPLHLRVPTGTPDGALHVHDHTISRLMATPKILLYLEEIAWHIRKPGRASFTRVIDFSETLGNIGYETVVETPSIQLNDVVTFAKRSSRGRLSRVIVEPRKRPTPTSRIRIWVEPELSNPTHWRLAEAYFGDDIRREPWSYNVKQSLPAEYRQRLSSEYQQFLAEEYKRSIAFWLTHAFLYDKRRMGPIVRATWQEVLTQRERFQMKGIAA